MVKFFGGNGQAFYLKKAKRLVKEKHPVRFKMIPKDEYSR